jgi:hypothetical protein
MKRAGEGDDKFIQMNARLRAASGAVQRANRNVLSMIDEPDQTGWPPRDPFVIKETTMLKTMSATLIAASLLVAPALAAGAQKAGAMPKTEQSTQLKSGAAKSDAMNSFAKAADVKSTEGKSLVKPHGKMTRRHHTYRHYAHRHHKKVSAMHASVKSHRSAKVSFNKTRLNKAGSKVSFKTTKPAVKRG